MTDQLSEERVEPIRCWEEGGLGWKSGVRVREGLLVFMSPDFGSGEAAGSWSCGRHQLTCTFFSSNFTPRRGDTHLIIQMVPQTPTF